MCHKGAISPQFEHLIGGQAASDIFEDFPEAIAEAMQRPTMNFVRCATMRAREIAILELRRAP